MRARLGLDQSLLDQYLSYLNGLIHGDLGQALINQEPVRTIIGKTLPASLELSVIALVLAAVVGLSIGFSGIARPEGKIDLGGRLYGLGTYALPPFWVAMLVQLVFAVSLGWLPVGGRFPPAFSPRGQRIFPAGQRSAEQLGRFPRHRASPDPVRRLTLAPAAAQRHLHDRPATEPATHPARRLRGSGAQPRPQ